MSRTFIRPETQIKTLDTFDDQIAAGSGLENTTWNLEQFLGGVISQVNRLLNTTVGGNNWYADLTAPTTFEGGAQRGVDDINQDLHDLEHKRVLVTSCNLTDITVPASASATGTLTLTGNVSAGDQVKLGALTYTFTSPLGASPGDVLLGATTNDSIDNLVSAINNAPAGAGAGTLWAVGTLANGSASATRVGSTMVATALVAGTAGNNIDSTDPTDSGGVMSWTATKLAGGAGDCKILALGELPSNTTAAVGAVTTLGTVVAYNATFGFATLDEVSGSTAVSPKNLCVVVDSDTRDPILSSGRVVYALFQTELATDGHTMTGTTPNRAQLSFVRINAAGDDLELVPSADIGGKEINYCSVTRKYLSALTEQDFLKGAEIDFPSSATVTRQIAYDNQGTTPVDVTTHSYLDLEGPGLVWQIRDDTEAILFNVIEGSAGGTSTVQLAAAVDLFDVNAVVNDFLNGASFDTGAAGTTINVGVTPNQIDSGGALTLASGGAGDLKLNAAAQLVFVDQWYAASTYDTDLVLSDSSAEWDAFETAFGEVSLLNAIVQAKTGNNRHRAVAEVTTTIAANTLIEGPSGPGVANISADLLDYRNQTFVDTVEIFINGVLQRNGANAAANYDVYPSAVAGEQQYGCFYAEYTLKASPGNPDVIQMFISGAL